MSTQTKLIVILHADVVGSTELVQENEHLAHVRMQQAFRALSKTASEHNGTVHEIRGDALVAEFERPSDAISAAFEFQKLNSESNQAQEDAIRLDIRIGIAMGEVIVADQTVTGIGVVLAQRIEQLASPGGVAISAGIRETLPGRLNVAYEDLGEMMLKGFHIPQRVYKIRQSIDRLPGSSGDTSEAQGPVDRFGNTRASIAVLPFENMSDDPEHEYFADGMVEDIITGLSKFRWLLVIARNSTFTYKGQAIETQKVAHELGVRYLLEGSVRRSGISVRVTAQLIDADSRGHLWANRYDRELQHIFDVQDELTGAIVAAIAPEIGQAEIARAKRMPPNGLDAWALYQRGLSLAHSGAEVDLRTATALFDKARMADPDFTDAHGMAAHMRARRALFFASEGDDVMLGEAEKILQAAFRQDRSNTNCLLARGYLNLYWKEFDLAASNLREAIALNPNLAFAYGLLGFVLNQAGHAREGLEALDVADRLNPRDPSIAGRWTTRAVSNFMLERFEQSAEFARLASRSENPRYWVDAILVAALYRLENKVALDAAKRTLLTRRPKFAISDVAHFLRPEITQALREAGLPEE